tara:strand:- start:544 stop:813 length:270 start_codon:yes stop_codon:yes gene_type:complete
MATNDSLKIKKKHQSPSGGLSPEGREYINNKTGSNLKPPVTESNPKGKRAGRKKSFCARMGGVKGPMKDIKGRPTRKALALRKWKCGKS